MADDVRLLLETGRELLFLGKAAVYSAGVTLMASFPMKNRFLTRDTRLVIHKRQLSRTIDLSGPLRSCTAQLKGALLEIKQSVDIENEGFRKLVDGSDSLSTNCAKRRQRTGTFPARKRLSEV